MLSKGGARPPAPPIPKPATEKAAPAHDPGAGLEPLAPAHATEAEHEPSDTAAQTGTEEPQDSQGFSRRIGGDRTCPDWFNAHPEWKTMGLSPKEGDISAMAPAQRPSSHDPNRALQRILVLRARGRHLGAEPTRLATPFHLKGPAGAKEFHSVQRVSPLQGREELEDEKARAILARMAESTQKTYTNQLKWWELFCKRRDLDPIQVVGNHNRASEEELLLDFVVHTALTNIRRSESTIKTRLAAIRALHVNLGLDDPMANMKRRASSGIPHAAPPRHAPDAPLDPNGPASGN